MHIHTDADITHLETNTVEPCYSENPPIPNIVQKNYDFFFNLKTGKNKKMFVKKHSFIVIERNNIT